MKDKIFKLTIILSTIGIILVGEFIIFILNYGLMPRNTVWIIIETIGVLCAAIIYYLAVTLFYKYCEELEEKENDLDRRDL